jgi:hypothetical protein
MSPRPRIPRLHVEWWLDGASGHGRVRVEITLDPQAVPKLQHMELTSVPEPSQHLRAAAEALVSAANSEATDEAPARGHGRRRRHRARPLPGERAVRPRDARPRDGGQVIERDVPGPRGGGAVDLALIVDEGGHILTATWTPCPVRPPISDVH